MKNPVTWIFRKGAKTAKSCHEVTDPTKFFPSNGNAAAGHDEQSQTKKPAIMRRFFAPKDKKKDQTSRPGSESLPKTIEVNSSEVTASEASSSALTTSVSTGTSSTGHIFSSINARSGVGDMSNSRSNDYAFERHSASAVSEGNTFQFPDAVEREAESTSLKTIHEKSSTNETEKLVAHSSSDERSRGEGNASFSASSNGSPSRLRPDYAVPDEQTPHCESVDTRIEQAKRRDSGRDPGTKPKERKRTLLSSSIRSMPDKSTIGGFINVRIEKPHRHSPKPHSHKSVSEKDVIYDDPSVVMSYNAIPLLELTKLPRGGVSLETQAVGRVQFGIPPETIKDSMRLGLQVPSVYIVPVERFCREMGPALGVNLAEFEFPAYFNFFVQRKRCTLIVDSEDAERNIRRVFSETLLGPAQFRRAEDPIACEEEDFAPDFPRDAIPNFQKELKHFRIMPDGKELVLETLLNFCHFEVPGEGGSHENLGIPPPLEERGVRSNPSLSKEKLRRATSDIEEETPVPMTTLESRHTVSHQPRHFEPEPPPPRMKISRSSPSLSSLGLIDDESVNEEFEEEFTSKFRKRGSIETRMTSFASDETEPTRNSPKRPERDDALGLKSRRETNRMEVPGADEKSQSQKIWTYSQAKWIGDVATVYPSDATPEQISARKTKRVEIFKMPGGTEYILHDVDENNHIVGKARFSGHVRVSASMSVDGFGGRSISIEENKDDADDSAEIFNMDIDNVEDVDEGEKDAPSSGSVLPPTFHPPSFGVTVLGNSHGFDKSGSVSGYVLWINGRGVMIDPPPYSSATLEREGIRPRTIVGIILTHCHADHDAGAFQKVLTGSPVVVITTPTIYKSFIRKYAALSALSPALLRHSHRYKPAIIGMPLRFQGATFHFTYTLHSIPCVGFRVEWRGRSMVFTGDHFNNPDAIDKLREKGVLSRARADDLQNLPLQETDLLLHEAGAPPIHTPLEVLLKLPQRVKKRLYVVHTSALPEGCELRVAPTGTAGTIRLDQLQKPAPSLVGRKMIHRSSIHENTPFSVDEDSIFSSLTSTDEYVFEDEAALQRRQQLLMTSFAHLGTSPVGGTAERTNMKRMSSLLGAPEPPLVSLRPTSSTDAWFILNLLSAVPFLSSLSYSSTMEVLETARVDAFCVNDVVVPASRRRDVLCVIWEGTCMERERVFNKPSADTSGSLIMSGGKIVEKDHEDRGWRKIPSVGVHQGRHKPLSSNAGSNVKGGAVWQAGDWTGPLSLQPEKRLSGESSSSSSRDIVAMSSQGVKVITIEFSNLHAILKSGSELYRKYLARTAQKGNVVESVPRGLESPTSSLLFDKAVQNLSVIELLDCNSALRKLSAVQKRHLESLAEGPVCYGPGQRLWRCGATVDKAFILVAGTVSFVPKRRNAGSVGLPPGGPKKDCMNIGSAMSRVQDEEFEYSKQIGHLSLGEMMRRDAMKAIKELGNSVKDDEVDSTSSSISSETSDRQVTGLKRIPIEPMFGTTVGSPDASTSIRDMNDYAELSHGLQKRADQLNLALKQGATRSSFSAGEESGGDFDDSHSSLDFLAEEEAHVHGEGSPSTAVTCGSGVSSFDTEVTEYGHRRGQRRRRSSRDRFANKVLGRLYSRRAFTAGLVFSRGHFLGDVSKMVAGLLSTEYVCDSTQAPDDNSAKYGFGEKTEGPQKNGAPLGELVIHEQEGDQHVVHSSTLAAGKDGCVVLVFPKSSFIPFLDEYPGLLLSLLGTQVVV